MILDQDNHDEMDVNSTDGDISQSDPESETRIPRNRDEESEEEGPRIRLLHLLLPKNQL